MQEDIFVAGEQPTALAYMHLLMHGFVILRTGDGAQRADRARAAFEACAERNPAIFSPHRDEHGHLPRIVNLHAVAPELIDLLDGNAAVRAVTQQFFCGDPATLYTSLYFEHGSAQSLHRDSPHFCTIPEYKYLGVWFALEDADEENGCLEVLRGGHLLPELPRESIALRRHSSLNAIDPNSGELWNDYQAAVVQQCREIGLASELAPVRKGDVLIWHPQLPHGGSAIRDLTRTRHSMVMHVAPMGVPVYHLDVFFNHRKNVSPAASWNYSQHHNTAYAHWDVVDIGHRQLYHRDEFASLSPLPIGAAPRAPMQSQSAAY